MPLTTQQTLTELATKTMPSAAIANTFNITGYEDNIFLKDWCMFVNGLYLINREYYRDFELDFFEPKPNPYSFSSPTFNQTIYTVSIDVEMDNFDIIATNQRDRGQPFNGVTGRPLDMNDYAGIFGSTFEQCPWLLVNFASVSPMQFVLDTVKIMQDSGEENITVNFSNKTTAMLASIKAKIAVATPQVPQYEDIILL